jgi:hypothetical protein
MKRRRVVGGMILSPEIACCFALALHIRRMNPTNDLPSKPCRRRPDNIFLPSPSGQHGILVFSGTTIRAREGAR